MKRTNSIILVLLVVALFEQSSASDYALNPATGTDSVFFRSSAKLEFIEGKSGTIEGGFVFDPENIISEVSGVLRVDLRELRTGIETRDGHMREQHLHTDEFPFAYFELVSIEPLSEPRAEAGSADSAEVSGFFYIHGVKRLMRARLEYIVEDGGILANVKFSIMLDDYEIERPRALFLKLAEEIKLELRFIAHPSKVAPIQLPDWQELR